MSTPQSDAEAQLVGKDLPADPAELVKLARSRCPDYLTDDTDAYDVKYPTWKDMFGYDVSIDQMKTIGDVLYRVSSNRTIKPLDKHGKWAFHRHKWNLRGDQSSRQSRKKSIESIGVLPDIREPPWVASHPELADHWNFWH